jgi:hypothetical protein
MKAAMARWRNPPSMRSPAGALALAGALGALASVGSAQAMGSPPAASTQTTTYAPAGGGTPAPVTTPNGSVITSAPAGGGTQAPAATPTGSGAPGGGTPAPVTTPNPSVATPSAAGGPAAPNGAGLPTLAGGQPGSSLSGARSSPRHSSRGLSTGAIVIAVAAGLLALGCAAWAVARRRALEPRWSLTLRHELAEASFRASATWAEFTDWVRLGH